jgi:hypothetical protein
MIEVPTMNSVSSCEGRKEAMRPLTCLREVSYLKSVLAGQIGVMKRAAIPTNTNRYGSRTRLIEEGMLLLNARTRSKTPKTTRMKFISAKI